MVIEGATGRIDSNRQSAAVELVSYLALNPGADHHPIDDALWPGRLVNKQMRNAVISRTRSWLGKNADGEAFFPRVQDTGDSRYRLAQAVTCDWRTFQGSPPRTGGSLEQAQLHLTRRRPWRAIKTCVRPRSPHTVYTDPTGRVPPAGPASRHVRGTGPNPREPPDDGRPSGRVSWPGEDA
ncbi:hypothetical protein [Streptomyces lateritius]|uniref:hypothetical protein n=1 Tax=Streptomyces lateritius TaxID=67313 RepID=UPI001C8C2A4E|nr:hypothetical protein [Streptomyces lateritius]MBX9427462.1 hypothetical protein [Streptomyces lateritius]